MLQLQASSDGLYLYRHLIHPDVKNLAFVGSMVGAEEVPSFSFFALCTYQYLECQKPCICGLNGGWGSWTISVLFLLYFVSFFVGVQNSAFVGSMVGAEAGPFPSGFTVRRVILFGC